MDFDKKNSFEKFIESVCRVSKSHGHMVVRQCKIVDVIALSPWLFSICCCMFWITKSQKYYLLYAKTLYLSEAVISVLSLLRGTLGMPEYIHTGKLFAYFHSMQFTIRDILAVVALSDCQKVKVARIHLLVLWMRRNS